MELELKNVKYNKAFSRETACFQANLYVDGKGAFYIENDGQGGPDNVFGYKQNKFDKALYQKVDDYCKTLPKDLKYGFEQNFESVCANLLTKWLCKRDMKRALKTKVLFKENNQSEGIKEIKIKPHKNTDIYKYINNKYPNAIILNNLAETDALNLWMAI